MSDDLLKRLSRIGERVSIPCPDNIRGCLVFHYRVDTDPACVEAIDEIERLKQALYAIAHYEENTDADYCEWYHALLNIARAALGEENK